MRQQNVKPKKLFTHQFRLFMFIGATSFFAAFGHCQSSNNNLISQTVTQSFAQNNNNIRFAESRDEPGIFNNDFFSFTNLIQQRNVGNRVEQVFFSELI